MGKLVNMAVFLIIALCILTPMVSALNDGSIFEGALLPEVTSPSTDDAGEYLENLMSATEEKLKSGETECINREFDLKEGGIELEFTGKIKEGRYELCHIKVKFHTFQALSKRDAVKAYLEEKYGCSVRAEEEII